MDKQILLSRISTREKEVIELIAQGLTTDQIGRKMNISSTTAILHYLNTQL